jgi:uncharacterized protein (TIGR00730 family)
MTTPDAEAHLQAILESPSYELAELDTNLLQLDEMRPVRMQLELYKPEYYLQKERVNSTIVVYGGTQVVDEEKAAQRLESAQQALAADPDSSTARRAVARAENFVAKAKYYEAAREFAKIVSSANQTNGDCDFVIVTGGGPGVMEAANRGAFEVGAISAGFNITLPEEQKPNPYITPDLCFQFHYFALRKMHFLMRAKAVVVFPGGFGTLDELFTALTLRQTGRMQEIPIILYGREYWEKVVDFQFLADEGVIADSHLDLLDFADTPRQAWRIIKEYFDLDA